MSDESKLFPAMDAHNVKATFLETVVAVLRGRGVNFESGLGANEFDEIEGTYNLRLPPDLRTFLQLSLPTSDGFPNWRGPQAALQKTLSWPVEGICFDIERNAFWVPVWGPRPTKVADALAFALQALGQAPKLIPVYKHRYIPAEPHATGNPVLSVYQTDIIHYGNDLPGYFNREFEVPLPASAAAMPRPIRFWDELIRLNAERD
jgi:hypothetical protein